MTDSSYLTASETSSLTKSLSIGDLKKSFRNPVAERTNSASRYRQPEPKWYRKLNPIQKASEPGKEKWRDASLSDKERWKEWQKAMDKQQHKGSTAGYYTSFYKEKKGWPWWVGLLVGE